MSVVVQKYGGSSVADVSKLEQVAEKVAATRKEGNDVVVVISAMGKTTDQLLSLAHQVDPNPPRRELDMLLSTGERVSMALLSMAIQKRGWDAISFTGSQSGIITNDRHFDARIIEVRPHRVEDELARGRIVIVAGYQGMSYRREITTLGRGGSDTTALAMAAALRADRAEIYSDVDGVYTADPRVVPGARHLAELSFEAMQEISEAGAKVLHAAAIEFARRAGIAIHARSTFESGRETLVHGASTTDGDRAVVGLPKVARFRVREIHFTEVLRRAERVGVHVRDVLFSNGAADFLVATAHVPDWQAARDSLRSISSDMTVDEGLGILTVVGDRFAREHAAVIEALEALGSSGITPHRVATSPLRFAAVVDEADLNRGVGELHRILFRTNEPGCPGT